MEINETYPEFIKLGEDILPGIRSNHRQRSISEIIRLFKYQRQYLHKRHAEHVERINQMNRNWDDPLCRNLAVAWTEQHNFFYQPHQRRLFGLFLSVVRMLGAQSISINYERLITYDAITVNDIPLAYFLANEFFDTPVPSRWHWENSNWAKLTYTSWFNYRHRGSYDLTDPEIFVCTSDMLRKYQGKLLPKLIEDAK